jgi:hypothetical protein
MTQEWKAFIKFKEPSRDDRGAPLKDLSDIWIFVRSHTGPDMPPGPLRVVRSIPASSPTGGAEHTVEFEGLVGAFEIEIIAVDKWGMQSKKEWIVLAFGDHPPGKPMITEAGTAYPYET